MSKVATALLSVLLQTVLLQSGPFTVASLLPGHTSLGHATNDSAADQHLNATLWLPTVAEADNTGAVGGQWNDNDDFGGDGWHLSAFFDMGKSLEHVLHFDEAMDHAVANLDATVLDPHQDATVTCLTTKWTPTSLQHW